VLTNPRNTGSAWSGYWLTRPYSRTAITHQPNATGDASYLASQRAVHGMIGP